MRKSILPHGQRITRSREDDDNDDEEEEGEDSKVGKNLVA